MGMVVKSIAGTLGKLWSRARADRWCISCGEGVWNKCGIRVRYVIRAYAYRLLMGPLGPGGARQLGQHKKPHPHKFK